MTLELCTPTYLSTGAPLLVLEPLVLVNFLSTCMLFLAAPQRCAGVPLQTAHHTTCKAKYPTQLVKVGDPYVVQIILSKALHCTLYISIACVYIYIFIYIHIICIYITGLYCTQVYMHEKTNKQGTSRCVLKADDS